MGKDTKSSKTEFYKLLKDRTKNRVEDLDGIFAGLRSTRKESCGIEVAELEEQIHQMIQELKNELSQPSPASSLQQGASLGLFPSDISKMLRLSDEEDDATSGLRLPNTNHDAYVNGENAAFFEATGEEYFNISGVCNPSGFEHYTTEGVAHNTTEGVAHNTTEGIAHNTTEGVAHNKTEGVASEFDYLSFEFPQDFDFNISLDEDALPQINGFNPPPSAFLGPKCALWDCTRPVEGQTFHYCNFIHADAAQTEGRLGMKPIVRPKGIELKDNMLFAAVSATAEGKNVGIPECEGAATARSPWNSPELFDIQLFEGETIREWLFFDKPRRAFESGNRKQRSLPDYKGRGWHESRKQVFNESGWLKKSYFMDPQPMKSFQWHLFEYVVSNCDACALYRLELKLGEPKTSPKGKIPNDSVADLQKHMNQLTAEFPLESKDKRSGKGRAKTSPKIN
ncbi:transcription factor VOZ1-like [Rutidosis leptorrhynchoides]|uniref:transcription factor VOZ1-like n=1 Tax=Rutidosis leptorrhynchoides TaxID=125765 RepID=UPI003A98D1A3